MDLFTFGLKVPPSLFQKAMTSIFKPLLNSAFIYIDEIVLFSLDEDSHKELFHKFYRIYDEHRVMLSSRKSQIGRMEVDFLGMHFT